MMMKATTMAVTAILLLGGLYLTGLNGLPSLCRDVGVPSALALV